MTTIAPAANTTGNIPIAMPVAGLDVPEEAEPDELSPVEETSDELSPVEETSDEETSDEAVSDEEASDDAVSDEVLVVGVVVTGSTGVTCVSGLFRARFFVVTTYVLKWVVLNTSMSPSTAASIFVYVAPFL